MEKVKPRVKENQLTLDKIWQQKYPPSQSKMSLLSFMPEKLDAIYGALVGGGVAIIVSFLSNRHALKRLKLELSHQAAQREIERQLALKREIYIPLLEAASNAMSFYAQIGTVSIELIKQPEPLNSLARHIAKLNIVASKDVVDAVNVSHKQLAIGTIKLFKERFAIEAISAQLSSAESQIKLHESRSESFNQRFEKHVDAGTGGKELRDVLIRLTTENQEAVQKLYDQKKDLMLQKATAELNLSRLALQDLKTFAPQNKMALSAIRKDLGLPIDEKWLSDLFDTNSKEVFAAVEVFHRDLENVIGNQLKVKKAQ
jgi:hypothetical protein